MDSKYKVGDDAITDVSKVVADGLQYDPHDRLASYIQTKYHDALDEMFREHVYCGHDEAEYHEVGITVYPDDGHRFHRECPTCGPKSVRLTVNLKAGY